MEIFQTIWTALTTENKLLIDLFAIPCNFIEVTINMLLFTIILNIQPSKQVKIKYILTVSICSIIFGFLIPNPYKSILSLLLISLCIYFFFKTSILKTILSTIIPILFTVLCESIMVKLSYTIFNFEINNIINIPLYRLIYLLCIQGLLFILYLIIKYSKIQISFIETVPTKNKSIILMNLVLALVSILIQFVITGFYLNRLPIYIVIFSNIALISYILLSIYSLIKNTQLELTSLNLEQEKENNKILKDM